jgi:beta-aspartyl-peptidase (threonine type)
MTTAQRACLSDALSLGHERLGRGDSALDAVEVAIRCLEGSGLFNAGVGSRLQLDGVKRMDAALMEGRQLRAGAVAGIEQVRHPISAARLVMERTSHVLLSGTPATRFARYFKLERQPAPTLMQRKAARASALKTAESRELVRFYEKIVRHAGSRRTQVRETVGAVALDRAGTVAAGASTGGIALMLPGRVGDTPLVGCGVYADDNGGAVSMTGIGEGIIRLAIAKGIVTDLIAGAMPSAAARRLLRALVTRIRGSAGALVLGVDGRFAIQHTTSHMSAGHWQGRGKPVVRDRFP